MPINEDYVRSQFEGFRGKAEELLKDTGKLEEFLQRMEGKLATVPLLGSTLADLTVLISLVRSYIRNEYRDVSTKSIITVICCLIYVFSGRDVILDAIPVLGFVDDVAVIALAMKLIGDDLDKYRAFRPIVAAADAEDGPEVVH